MKVRPKIRMAILLVSFIFYPVTFLFMSPDMLFFGASEGIIAGDVLFFCAVFFLSLFMGRLFCGWLCPAGALQEFAFSINDKPVNHRWNWIKIALFFPWLCFFVFLALRIGGFKHIDILYMRASGIPLDALSEWIMYFMTVAIVLALALLIGKRGFCRYLCWVSPFMIIGGAIRDLLNLPAIRLKTIPDLCNSCGLCSRACPMSIPVEQMAGSGEIRHRECIHCATCIDTCPRTVIKFAIMLPVCLLNNKSNKSSAGH